MTHLNYLYIPYIYNTYLQVGMLFGPEEYFEVNLKRPSNI